MSQDLLVQLFPNRPCRWELHREDQVEVMTELNKRVVILCLESKGDPSRPCGRAAGVLTERVLRYRMGNRPPQR